MQMSQTCERTRTDAHRGVPTHAGATYNTHNNGYEGFVTLCTHRTQSCRPPGPPTLTPPSWRARSREQRLRRGIAAVVRSSGGKARLEIGQELEH